MRNVSVFRLLMALLFGMLALQSLAQPSGFTYPPGPHCQFAPNLLPATVNTPGSGTFSEGTGNVVFADNVTGEIDLSLSMPGTWSIRRLVGNDSTVNFLTILQSDDASFTYVPDSACEGAANFVVPIVLGNGGGIFVSSSSALFMNGSTGAVDLNNTPPGTYPIAYQTTGQCPAMAMDTLTILEAADASFQYSQNDYCSTEDTILPFSIAMPMAGVFHASPPGLVLDSSTGALYPSASQSGTYTVEYVINGLCPGQWQETVTITELYTGPLFIYLDSVLCTGDSAIIPVVLGPGNLMYFAPAGLVWGDRNIGEIAVGASLPGIYTVVAELGGPCNESQSQTIVIADSMQVQLTLSGDTLYAPGPGTGFQWYLNGSSIPGANAAAYYTGGVQGQYEVKYHRNGDTCGTHGVYDLLISVPESSGWLRSARIFPNPSHGLFEFDLVLQRPEELSWELYNVWGARVAAGGLGKSSTFHGQWDWTWLAAGHYCLRVHSERDGHVAKIEILK